MSIEKPYQPSPEEIKKTEEIMAEKQENIITRNRGQEINFGFPAHWKTTVYADRGFDYRIIPENIEFKNEEYINSEIAKGKDREDIIDKLSEEYIKNKEEELNLDRQGYVSAQGRVYTDLMDPRIKELEK